jgi:hypothetical protein
MSISALRWIVSALAIVVLLLMLGAVIKEHPLGVLVDARNKMSLSRLQVVLWTVLLVSAFFAIAWQTGKMEIYLAPELWALMAISTGSAAGAVIIKSTKAAQQPAATVNAPAAAARLGVLLKGDKPRFSNMFEGEEVTDGGYIDIAKVQMFFFTIAAIVGYTIALANHDFTGVGAGVTLPKELAAAGYKLFFPAISTALVTLIGISHAGYLTVKAAPHTPTT